jgi:cytochrome bd-type quinol oxidase subunit 2
MSPSKGRQQFIQSRPRSELLTAIAVSATIVIVTAALIWLMRPGATGAIGGGGGLFNRQPRMTILVLLAVAVLAGVALYVLRRRHPPRFGTQGSIAIGSAVTIVLAVVAGIFWPGGAIRHWPKQLKITTPPTTSVPATTAVKPGTTVKTGTTKPVTTTTKAG